MICQRYHYWIMLLFVVSVYGGPAAAEPVSALALSAASAAEQISTGEQVRKRFSALPSARSQITTVQGPRRTSNAPAVAPVEDEHQKWNLKDVDIRTVISRVSKETGKNFVIDPRVQGKVTLVSQQDLGPDELYLVFLATLQVNGFVAVDTDGITRIVREQDISAITGPLTEFPSTHFADENIVKVVHVEHVPVKELMSAIKPLTPKTSQFTIYEPSNNVIISDRAGNVARITEIIRELDKPWSQGTEVIRLREGSPTDIVNTIQGIQQGNTRGRSEVPISLAADERTNSILMSGPPSKRLQIRALIANLDRQTVNEGNLHVVYLKYTRAKELAPILSNIISSYEIQQSSRGTSQSGVNRSDTTGSFNRSSSSYGSESSGSSSISELARQGEQLFNASDDRQKSGGSGSVQWEDTTNALIIKASPALMKMIRSVVAKLDIRRPQVLVEAIIAEVDVDQANSLGVEWNTAGNDKRIRTRFPVSGLSSIGGPLGGDGVLGLGSAVPGVGLTLGFFSGNNLRTLVRAITSDSRNNVLATPNIITLDNETANIKVGEKVPFQTGSTTNDNGTTVSIAREEVGLSLTIRPQITQTGSIKLQINHVLSNVIVGSSINNPANNPTTSERIITTNVVVDDGETLVLGGLIRSDWIQGNDRIPLLGNIPILGRAFRSDERRVIKRNLMVFIRPVILRDKNDNIEVTTGKYNNIRKMQLESYREVPQYAESPALRQLTAPLQLPPPLHMQHVSYKELPNTVAQSSDNRQVRQSAQQEFAEPIKARKKSYFVSKRRRMSSQQVASIQSALPQAESVTPISVPVVSAKLPPQQSQGALMASTAKLNKPNTGAQTSLTKDSYHVQAATFGDARNAQRLTAKLRAGGYDAFIKNTMQGEKSFSKVIVAPQGETTRRAAENMIAKLHESFQLQGIVRHTAPVVFTN